MDTLHRRCLHAAELKAYWITCYGVHFFRYLELDLSQSYFLKFQAFPENFPQN